jgi:hypothetical protein
MTATRQSQVEDHFLDLVLDDDELVRAEFDALIAATWESPCEPPQHKSGPPVGGWAAAPPPARWPRRPGLPIARTVRTRRPQGRQRGPPHRWIGVS